MNLSSFQIYCENKIAHIVYDYRQHPSPQYAVWISIQEVALEILGRGVAGIEFLGKSVIHIKNRDVAEPLFFLGIETFASSLLVLILSPVWILMASVFAIYRGDNHWPMLERPARNLAGLS